MTHLSARRGVPAASYGRSMTPDEVDEYARSLPRCKRKGTEARPAWYVDDRLVARLEDATIMVVRMDFDVRERMTAAFPETFGVPPRFEQHLKAQVALDRGNDDAIRDAIRLAWEMQHR
jgi:hypothetical protein